MTLRYKFGFEILQHGQNAMFDRVRNHGAHSFVHVVWFLGKTDTQHVVAIIGMHFGRSPNVNATGDDDTGSKCCVCMSSQYFRGSVIFAHETHVKHAVTQCFCVDTTK